MLMCRVLLCLLQLLNIECVDSILCKKWSILILIDRPNIIVYWEQNLKSRDTWTTLAAFVIYGPRAWIGKYFALAQSSLNISIYQLVIACPFCRHLLSCLSMKSMLLQEGMPEKIHEGERHSKHLLRSLMGSEYIISLPYIYVCCFCALVSRYFFELVLEENWLTSLLFLFIIFQSKTFTAAIFLELMIPVIAECFVFLLTLTLPGE